MILQIHIIIIFISYISIYYTFITINFYMYIFFLLLCNTLKKIMINQGVSCCRYVVKGVFLLYIYIYIIRIFDYILEHRLQGGVFWEKKA